MKDISANNKWHWRSQTRIQLFNEQDENSTRIDVITQRSQLYRQHQLGSRPSGEQRSNR